MRKRGAFTLVELLVVIGIIAVLIGVLLPALAGARKQAAAVKCATQLREIFNAMQMYALENHGYLPPPQLVPTGGRVYNVDGIDYPVPGTPYGAYWFTFLTKYVTKAKTGMAAQTSGEDAQARRTIFWGCTEWGGYTSPAAKVQIGYGMNHYPTFTENYPAPGLYPPRAESTFIQTWTPGRPDLQQGNFAKLKTYARLGSKRALVMDSQFWLAEAQPPPASGVIPGQKLYDGQSTYSGIGGQTLADFYRHGKFPPVRVGGATGYYQPTGGKVAFNILYCDGHVNTEHDRRAAYLSLRLRFPR